jgi:dihydrofolate reductase
MGKTVLYMSMSVDGFIAGPNEGPGNGLGDGGHRLHEWFLPGPGAGHQGAAGRLTGVNREIMDEVMATGAVVAGRRTFELAGGWAGDHQRNSQDLWIGVPRSSSPAVSLTTLTCRSVGVSTSSDFAVVSDGVERVRSEGERPATGRVDQQHSRRAS